MNVLGEKNNLNHELEVLTEQTAQAKENGPDKEPEVILFLNNLIPYLDPRNI